MSRLTIDISGEQHQQIKAMAAVQGKSIKDYVVEKLFPDDWSADEKAAWAELKTLLKERVDAAEQGAVSSQSIDEVVEETLAEPH